MYESILRKVYKSGEADFFSEIYPNTRYFVSFRDYVDFLTPLEKEVLKFLGKKDRILDIGAGRGRISGYFQDKGYNITALDKTEIACKIMYKKKIKRIISRDIFDYVPSKKYDVALFIRNYSIFGIKEENIIRLLVFLKDKIIKRGGKLIFFLKKPRRDRAWRLKRRLIFRDEASLWLESICPSIKEMTRLAKKSGWLVAGSKEDKKKNYAIIFKNVRF